MNNLELRHYGVKGMKWGVRKAKPTSSASKSNKKFGTGEDPSEKELSSISKLRKKSVKAWDDFDKVMDSTKNESKRLSAKTKAKDIDKKYADAIGSIVDKKFGNDTYSKFSKDFYRQNDSEKQKDILKFLSKYNLL